MRASRSVLIALSSAVLLMSDLRQRKGAGGRIRRVAIVPHASQPVLDDGVRGMLDALAANGFIDGRSIAIQRFNAENDLPTLPLQNPSSLRKESRQLCGSFRR